MNKTCCCCKLPTIATYDMGKKDYCYPCYKKKEESIDLKWAFWTLAVVASIFFYLGRISA